MVGAGGQRLELTIRVDGIPLDGDEDPLYVFQGGMSPLVTPRI
jgi:hypothetical protein